MARTKTEVLKFPEAPSGDGFERVTIAAKLPVNGEKDAEKVSTNFELVLPSENNEGVYRLQELLQTVEAPNSDIFVARCIRYCYANSVKRVVTMETVADAPLIVPVAPSLRTIDAAQAAGDWVRDKLRRGEQVSAEELQMLCAGQIPGM